MPFLGENQGFFLAEAKTRKQKKNKKTKINQKPKNKNK